jgi:acetyl-CoA/propionyl-CoA carboxylase, biotin carboxylase, biotin carboxyl carrier protein
MDDFGTLFTQASAEALAAFRNPEIYLERFFPKVRHVEIQVFGDSHGNAIHLWERDCTIQRRHQKLVEETPSPAVGPELRARIGQIAVDAARAVGYRSAGTIEGLLDRDGNYYFLEMNTRIQVEHTVTEMATGIDLVREQIQIAAGEPISFGQDDVHVRGHAIECRINAEDPANGFLPSPGVITRYREPDGPGVRVDSGVTEGSEIVPLYDPLIAKLVVWDRDRESARLRMLRALEEFEIEGVTTLVGFHRALLSHPCFVEAATCHGIVESEPLARRAAELAPRASNELRAQGRTRGRTVEAEVDGRRFEVTLALPEAPFVELARRRRERVAKGSAGAAGSEAVVSPMQGTVLSVEVADGDEVAEGQVICVVEAMKMENEIAVHRTGVVSALSVAPGQAVKSGQVICVVSRNGAGSADPG